MMKILNVNNCHYLLGGAERYYFNLARLLESRGHEVIPFSIKNERNLYTPYQDYFMSPPDFFGKKNFFDYIETAARVVYSSEAKTKINRLIQKTKPDIAHLHVIFHGISPSVLAVLKNRGIPVVQTVHSFELICPTAYMYIKRKPCSRCKGHRYFYAFLYRCNRGLFWASLLCCLKMYIHKFMKIYENNIDFFITPSGFMRDKLIEFGFPAEKIRKLPLFIDSKEYLTDFEPDSNYILYFGRLAEYKGVLTLVKAMEKIKKLKLYIAGEGGLRPDLEELIKKLKLENVELIGYKAGTELKKIIRQARFVVVPSEWYENSGYVVLESFACGKAVIASKSAGMPELLEDNKDSLLFEPGNLEELIDKIQFLADNPSLANDMGRQARIKAEEKYNPELHYESMKAIYRELL